MLTGWFKYEGNTYYFEPSDGVMHNNWTFIDGKKYFFTYEGIMLTGRQTIRGNKYYIAENGVVQTGLITLDDGVYYFYDPDGYMVTGWVTVSGNLRYFDPSTGKMVTNQRVDTYNIGADGIAKPMSAVQTRGAAVIASIGKSVSAVYNYVTSHNSYKYIEATRTLAAIQSTGWAYFANYSLDNRYVVCYYFAAVTDLLFQEAGFTSRIVYGTGRGDGDRYWNQVLVNGTWLNYDTCNGFYGVTDTFLKTPYNYDSAGRNTGSGYTFRQYIYPNFN